MTEISDTVRELCAVCNFRMTAPCSRTRSEANAPAKCEAAKAQQAAIDARHGPATDDIMLLG